MFFLILSSAADSLRLPFVTIIRAFSLFVVIFTLKQSAEIIRDKNFDKISQNSPYIIEPLWIVFV